MKSRPIIFDAESVRAILAGTKTMTRRVVKPQPTGEPRAHIEWSRRLAAFCGDHRPDPVKLAAHAESLKGHIFPFTTVTGSLCSYPCRYGRPGDELWVRETFCSQFVDPPGPNGYYDGWWYKASNPEVLKVDGDGSVVYRKDGVEASPWVSPMRMPREASRITLRVTDVRVERVQVITEADAKAEGVETDDFLDRMDTILSIAVEGCGPVIYPTLRTEFERRWDSINAKRGFSWESNPWVFVVSFERTEAAHG